MLGLVKAPVRTTGTQVCTRVVQVWIWRVFPASTAASRAFPALVLAWAGADVVRYCYLAVHLHGRAPRALVWLRCVYVQLCEDVWRRELMG